MNTPLSRAALIVALLVGVGIGYRACSGPKAIPNPFDKYSRAHEPFAAFAKRLAGNPSIVSKLNARARSSADPKSLGFEIAENGMRRLDDAALEKRMTFALKLVEHMDEATCAALARPDSERNRQLMPKILKA
ncbi:MAG: hypothetical protein JNK75_13050, partial [Betaproteobacteria bacterium]|nr:hypothetical protein [Betaproteobacteria bacterium]